MNSTAEKLPEVTIESNLTNDEYHALPSYSSSQVKDFINHPPAYFYAKYIEKSLTPVERKAFTIGNAVHTLFMEPEKFAAEYVVAPEINRRTNVGKAQWAEFLISSKDQILMSHEQAIEAAAIVKSLNRNKNAVALKQGCLIEQSIFWTDQETGLDLRVRPDMWRRNKFIPDLKTTKDASISSFQRDIFNYGYHISAAMYLDGLKQLGEDISDFIFICVENKEPYLNAIYTLSDEALEIGRSYYREALRGIANCLETNRWPSHNDDAPAEISLPQWVINRENI